MYKFALAAIALALGAPAHAQSDGPNAASTPSSCRAEMSEAASGAWQAMGGPEGRLGCPLGAEGETATSPQGTKAREVRFGGGVVLRHMSGALEGKAFAVSACERTYVQYGGPIGWLGLPVSDAVNTPDGQRQRFEGGTLMLYRATGICEADRPGA